MAVQPKRTILRQIHTIYSAGNIASLTDRQLLERFATRDGEAAELAFAAIVERHGPMILHVCRGVLRNDHDAQDAFQATFLVLVRKARTLWVRDSLGPWLHDVAWRVARHARSAESRRTRHERRSAEMAPPAIDAGRVDDVSPTLHEEIHRLPGRCRAPIVLCDLGGLTHEQAARQLGLPVGTVKSRLARGRERLRARLIRRGLAPTAGMLGTTINAEAAVPTGLAELTVRAARHLIEGKTAATGVVSAAVAALSKGAIKTMILSRVTYASLFLVSAGFVVIGTAALVGQEPGADPTGAPARANSAPDGTPSGGPDPSAPAPGDPQEDLKHRLVDIARRRHRLVDIARRRLDTQRKFYEEGRITIDRYLDASTQLMEAERQTGETLEARIAAARAHLDRVKEVEMREREELQKGRSTKADVEEAEVRRIQAELDLKNTGNPDAPRAIAAPDRLRYELDLLRVQLEAKKAEVRRAEAQAVLANTVMTTDMRLNQGRPGMVSKEELQKAQNEFTVAVAQVALVQAEVKEIELRIGQMKSLEGHPERIKEYLDRVNPSGSPVALERRLREVERKLERILETLEGSKRENPVGSFPPPRR